MKKFKSMLLSATLVAAAATTTLADGQIPIGGRPGSEPAKTNTGTVITANDPKSDVSIEISDYLWTIIRVIGRF